jgi:hypothetical protein
MKVGKLLLVLSLLPLALAVLWFAPLTEAERELGSLKEQDRWELCDYKHESDRLFVLRLYGRIRPLLGFLRDREEERVRSEFRFKLVASRGFVNAPDPYYWGDLKSRALRLSRVFSLRHWVYWEDEVQELLRRDRERLARKFSPARKAFMFSRQDGVERVSTHEFRVLLHPGDFEPAQKAFQETIEKHWKLPPYQLRVVWTKSDPRAYKFIFSPFGPANTVNFDKKSIRLTEYLSDGVLIHEIGHVLGFDDHYEYRWDEKKCLVSGQVYLRDVMANSAFKTPLKGHWLLLKKAYPLAKATLKERHFKYKQAEVFAEGEGERLEASARRAR